MDIIGRGTLVRLIGYERPVREIPKDALPCDLSPPPSLSLFLSLSVTDCIPLCLPFVTETWSFGDGAIQRECLRNPPDYAKEADVN